MIDSDLLYGLNTEESRNSQGCKHVLDVPIKMIWDHSINTGIVPQCCKLSHIAPLYKKGSKAIAANYRPVSLTLQFTHNKDL